MKFESNFDYERIQSLFSNLSSLPVGVIRIKKIIALKFSTDITLQLQKYFLIQFIYV